MAISISGNVGSLLAQKSLLDDNKETHSALARLSSGKRVNSAQDDAVALAIAVSLTAQQTGFSQAIRNAGDATDVVDTADAALADTTDVLSRMRELEMAAGSGALDVAQRGDIQTEITSLQAELDRVAHATELNGTSLLGARAALTYQVGAGNVAANDRLTITLGDTSAAALGLAGIGAGTQPAGAAALDGIDQALDTVSSTRAALGTQSMRASFASWLAENASVNLASARSSLVDSDVATESSNLSRDLILGHAAASVLAQANQRPTAALRLLGEH